jgi:hypothetical protein
MSGMIGSELGEAIWTGLAGKTTSVPEGLPACAARRHELAAVESCARPLLTSDQPMLTKKSMTLSQSRSSFLLDVSYGDNLFFA